MTEQRTLAEILELCEKATKGPLTTAINLNGGPDNWMAVVVEGTSQVVAVMRGGKETENAVLFAAARTELPRLAAVLKQIVETLGYCAGSAYYGRVSKRRACDYCPDNVVCAILREAGIRP